MKFSGAEGKSIDSRGQKSQVTGGEVAAIVLNYNAYEETRECIESLVGAGFSLNAIYLIDNCSPDGSGKLLREMFSGVRYHRSSHNSGYAGGNNCGLRLALVDGFRYLLVINNDIVVQPGFLQPLLETFSLNKDVGAVTGKVLYKDTPDIINAAGGKLSKLLCTGASRRIGERNDDQIEKIEIDFIPGMLILLKREVVERVGFMNESFFLYFEDLEYSLRIHKLFRMMYTSASVVYHKSGGGMKGKAYTDRYLYYYTRNRLWFFREARFSYRLYVLLFSLVNCIHKSVILLSINTFFLQFERKKLISLWKGFFAGAFPSMLQRNM